AAVTMAVAGGALVFLYRASIEQTRIGLRDMVVSEVALIESVAELGARYFRDRPTMTASDETILQVVKALRRTVRDKAREEFVLVWRNGGRIEAVSARNDYDLTHPLIIPATGPGEVERMAAGERSGVAVGVDQRGNTVLAAFAPIPILHAGLLVKLKMAEVRAPFIRAAGIALSLAVFLVTAGAVLLLRLTNPLIRRLQVSESQQRAVLDHVLDGIITIDEGGIVQRFNTAAERIFGYSSAEVVGHKVNMLMPEPDRSRHDMYLQNYLVTGHSKVIGNRLELVGRRNDGSLFPLDLGVSEIQSGHGRLFTGVVRDIAERKQAEEALNRFKYVLDNTLDMIFMFDADTLQFVYANHGAVDGLGNSEEELLQMHAYDITPLIPEPVFRSMIAPLLSEDKKALYFETVHRRKNGTDMPVDIHLQLVREHADSPGLFIAIARDITERKRIDRMKSEFVSTVSHELRTPLTSIRGSLGLLAGGVAGEMPDAARSLLEIATSNSERLSRLINDILDIEKIEAGQMKFDMSVFDLMPVVEQSLEMNRGLAEQYNVHFVLTETVPGSQVYADAERLLQVLANFLSNAAKFSPPGDVATVSVKAAGHRVRVEVRDHGPGIPLEFRGRIFQKFSQADASDTRQKGGTGLGLSISKAIVERLGGEIGFDTEPGGGASFYFDLPEMGGVIIAPPGGNVARRILVCEDDPAAAESLAAILRRNDYRVDIAESAAAAKRLLGQRDYGVMTVDISLPDQDGLSLMRELQAQERFRDLPMLVVSVSAGREKQEFSGNFTVLDWLEKPFSQPHLLAALARARLKNAEGTARVLHVEDDEDIQKVVRVLLEDQAEVTACASLAQARDLLRGAAFDLAILDVGLPDGSGLDLLPLLAEGKTPTPVMIFSAQDVGGQIPGEVAAALVKSRTSNQKLLATIHQLMERV
ncbi:MAG TPA: hypothetical protein DEP05_00880, partial [Betaproteobacteria bacterium]|nr:hypothetical protein [Betaproteobacteria bacterium]